MKKFILPFLFCISFLMIFSYAKEEYIPVQEGTFRNHTYQLFDESLTWFEARDYCASIGGYLVTITSKEEQKVIETLIDAGKKNQYWLGGTDKDLEGNWTWITDEPWSYDNWSMKPDNHNGNEHYLQIFRTKGFKLFTFSYTWNDMNKNNTIEGEEHIYSLEHIGFICEFGEPFKEGETYFDSKVSDWSLFEIEDAYETGLIPPSLVGKDLRENITRAEFAALSVLLYEKLSGKISFSSQSPFTDIAGNPNEAYIKNAYQLGITVGVSDTEFNPNASIWREQLAAMLCRTVKKYSIPGWAMENDDSFNLDISGTEQYKDHDKISAYAIPSVYYLTKHGIISGIRPNVFSPKADSSGKNTGTASREQAIAMAMRIMNNKEKFK